MTNPDNSTPIYRRLSQLIAMLPADTACIAEATGVTKRATGVWIRHLRAEGIVGYGDLRQRVGRVIVPGNGRRFEQSHVWASAGVQTFCRAWHALAARQTTDSLAAAVGASRRTMSDLLMQMRTHGLVRIGGWELRGQNYAPVYDRLPAPDVPRPTREPRVDVNSRYWAARRERMGAQAAEGRAA